MIKKVDYMQYNFFDTIYTHLRQHPEKLAIRYLTDGKDNVLSRQELLDKVLYRAKEFKHKIGDGDSALLIYTPGLDFIISFLACLVAGIIAIPSYPPIQRRLTNDLLRLELICRDSNAKMIIADSTSSMLIQTSLLTENVKSFFTSLVNFNFRKEQVMLKKIPLIVTNEQEKKSHVEREEIAAKDQPIAFIQYSSGSTGNPKGVMVSHENLIANSKQIIKTLAADETSSTLSWLPHYHDMGLIGFILVPLSYGMALTLLSPFDFIEKPFRWLQAITKYRPSHTGAPNFGYELCIKALLSNKSSEKIDLSSLKVALCGAEPINPEIYTKLNEFLNPHGLSPSVFMPSYGLAENTLMVSANPCGRPPQIKTFNSGKLQEYILEETDRFNSGDNSKRIISCGKSIEEQQLLIVDPETKEVLGEGKIGEIWIKGNSVALGYWNKTEETEFTFHATTLDRQGPFLRTGDLGFLLDQELFVYGRIKDVIIIRGKKFAPQDIELSVQHAHPGVRVGNVAAFSVEQDNEERMVVVAEVATHKYIMKYDEICLAILKKVAVDHEVSLSSIILIPAKAIFKTTSGKIKRSQCKTAYLNNELTIVGSWKSPTLQRV